MSALSIHDFLSKYRQGNFLLLDARSEQEFARGHIPGAVNVPLLNNEHRAATGTTYKKSGRQAAVMQGFELVGPKFYYILNKINELRNSQEVMVYCWRGGMRSNIICWLLSMAGIGNTVLKGGYKSYRRLAVEEFQKERKILILGGKTGSGKTEALEILKQKGEQVVNLEAIASHKGSAFGALGMEPQPTQEQFENLLAFELLSIDEGRILWLENESRNIGAVKIPDPVFEMMRQAAVAELVVSREERRDRIAASYGGFPVSDLAEKTEKLVKRMGGQHVKEALAYLHEGNKPGWINKLLEYYDKTYDFSNSQRDQKKIYHFAFTWKEEDSGINELINHFNKNHVTF